MYHTIWNAFKKAFLKGIQASNVTLVLTQALNHVIVKSEYRSDDMRGMILLGLRR